MSFSRYWKILILGGVIGALLVGVTLGASPASPPDDPAPVLAAIAPAHTPISVVGYWEPGGEVVGVVDVADREILEQSGGWLRVRVDGDGVVWVRAGELLAALGETTGSTQ